MENYAKFILLNSVENFLRSPWGTLDCFYQINTANVMKLSWAVFLLIQSCERCEPSIIPVYSTTVQHIETNLKSVSQYSVFNYFVALEQARWGVTSCNSLTSEAVTVFLALHVLVVVHWEGATGPNIGHLSNSIWSTHQIITGFTATVTIVETNCGYNEHHNMVDWGTCDHHMVGDVWSPHGGGRVITTWWGTCDHHMVGDVWSPHGGGCVFTTWWRTCNDHMVGDMWSSHGGRHALTNKIAH